MTIRELVTAVARRWYVVLGILLIAGVVTAYFIKDGGSYTTNTVVAFTLPSKTSFSPDNGTDDASVIAFAGAVAQEVNGGRAAMSYSMNDAPFYGAGIRQGVLVGLPNAGNQWVNSYLRAEIDVQIVGRTREWVEATQADVVDRVIQTTKNLQAPVVSQGDNIVATVVPLTLQIEHVSPTRSNQLAAIGAMLLAAFIVGSACAVLVDRPRAHRIRRRAYRDQIAASPLFGETST